MRLKSQTIVFYYLETKNENKKYSNLECLQVQRNIINQNNDIKQFHLIA